MGLFDVFTGAPAKKAAQQQRQFLGQTQDENQGYIGEGYGAGRDALTTGFGYAAGDVWNGYSEASGYLGGGLENTRNAYDSARGYLGQAGGAYDSLANLGTKYGGATSLALNALGVNGGDAQNTARGSFEAGPGYSFNMDQGLEAINRRRAAGGMLDSGNADRDSQVFGAGLASQEYDKWMNNLLGFTGAELGATSGAASGRAGAFTGMANLTGQQAGMENQYGQNMANLSTGRGSMLADLAKSYGGQMAGNYTGEANALTGSNNQLAGAYANTYKNEADAQMQGSGNLWGLGMNLAKLGTGMWGGKKAA